MDRIEIAIDAPQGTVYPVRITTAAGEQATATLTVPQVDVDGEVMLTKLAYRDQQTSFSEDEVIALGQWLYGLLFQGATAGLFQSATSQSAIAKRPLQIQLHFASHPDLVPVAALPWEFLTDPQGHPLVTRYSLVRSLPHTSPISPLTVDGPLTMLLAWALPAELANDYPLSIEAEVQAIQTQLQPLIDAQQITFHILTHTTPLSLNRAIQDHQPHLLHLLGHGQAATSGTPQLVLETDEGEIQVVSPRTLSVALQGSEVRLIVLNACHSGAQGTQLFQAFGPALLTSGIPAVVGMQASVLDRAGRIFATELYRTLVKTGSIDQAVQQGRKALILTDVSQVDWGLATLYLRARDGLLFGKPNGNMPPQSPPSAGGGTVFNQQGQQVGTQYNAGRDLILQSGIPQPESDPMGAHLVAVFELLRSEQQGNQWEELLIRAAITSTNTQASTNGRMIVTVGFPLSFSEIMEQWTFRGGDFNHEAGLAIPGYTEIAHAHSMRLSWNDSKITIFPGDWHDFYANSFRFRVPHRSILPNACYLFRVELFTLGTAPKSALYAISTQDTDQVSLLTQVEKDNQEKTFTQFWDTYHRARDLLSK